MVDHSLNNFINYCGAFIEEVRHRLRKTCLVLKGIEVVPQEFFTPSHYPLYLRWTHLITLKTLLGITRRKTLRKIIKREICQCEADILQHAQFLKPCTAVLNHLLDGKEECPFEVYCQNCGESEECGFYEEKEVTLKREADVDYEIRSDFRFLNILLRLFDEAERLYWRGK